MEFNTTNKIIFPEYGYQDKVDSGTGLVWDKTEKRITTRKHLIFADSRDCIGTQSIVDTQTYYKTQGGKDEQAGSIRSVTGDGVSPIVITVSGTITTDNIQENDKVAISRVQGNLAANGIWRAVNINYTTGTFQLQGSIGNGNYTGGGMWIRPADPGYPRIQNTDNIVQGNRMIINLAKKLKVLRSLSLIHAVVPRDIIPLQVYLPDFIEFAQFTSGDVPTGPQVRVATTVNLTFAETSIDGVALQNFDRVLVKNQANPIENGIYIYTFVLIFPVYTRADDMPTGQSADLTLNYYVNVTEGTTNTGTSWIVTSAGPGAVGTDAIVWSALVGNPISWASYIPQEQIGLEFLTIGFYSTPLQLFRTYISGSFPLPNAYTPPPLKLWNPTVGGVTHQLQPYPYQTVPTYTSDTFTVLGRTGLFYIICSGYGVYDLHDWTYLATASSTVNSTITDLVRKILLFAIVVSQSYRDVDYVELIANCSTVSNTTATSFFGYGDFQRFLPGPGLGMAYQPGTRDGADPTVASVNSPIPFPNFRGNVWGPYNSPGDRFQKMGVRDTLQDLYLNGDTANIFGSPIVKPWVKVRDIPYDNTFGIYFQALIPLTFANHLDATNPNIVNAMRIRSNGYGALSVTQFGDDQTFTEIFLNAGGQGPDTAGLPVSGLQNPGTGGAWVDNEVLDPVGGGVFGDEIAVGSQYVPTTGTMIVESSDATYVGDETVSADAINRRRAWSDRGIDSGAFITEIEKYRDFATKEIPDTNLVMRVFEAERDIRIQSTNSNCMDAIFNCPIRLNLGSSSGTQEYVENIYAFLAGSQEYWTKRFLAPLQSLYKLHIEFTAYNGTVIPLERMLQPRRSVILLQQFQRVFGSGAIDSSLSSILNNFITNDLRLAFLFDPLNPNLIGREKRNISLIFQAETYEYDSPGLYLRRIIDMLEADADQENNENPNILKASNYQNYLGL